MQDRKADRSRKTSCDARPDQYMWVTKPEIKNRIHRRVGGPPNRLEASCGAIAAPAIEPSRSWVRLPAFSPIGETGAMRCATIIACMVTMVGIMPGFAEERVTLVIGNSNYQHVGRLPNPVNDAAAIATLLRFAGFAVVEPRSDIGRVQMRRAISDFAETMRDSDIAVIYFAGHGIEVDGTNYLIPFDAVLARDFDVEDETISLDCVLRAIEPARRLRLVILDSCPNNPFTESIKRTTRAIGGLARVEPGTPNALIAFAAKGWHTGEAASVDRISLCMRIL
jgi:hypothetical protein